MVLKKSYDLLKEFSEFNRIKNDSSNYNDAYIKFGDLCYSILGSINIDSADKYGKLGIFFMNLHKIIRLGNTMFNDSPSVLEKTFDNARDLSIYAAMFAELLQE